jgi:hypothetical protein
MIGVLTITASAAAIGVNVPPGYVLEVDSQFTQGMSEICPSFIAGLNKNLALGVMYDTYFKIYMVSGRYVIVKNVAADLFYRVDGSNTWMADLRAKYFPSQSLALAGKYKYDSLYSGSSVMGQAEYLFNEHWLGNAGVIYANSTTSLLLGAEFFTGNIDIGLNCAFMNNDFNNPMIEVVVDYLIKK